MGYFQKNHPAFRSLGSFWRRLKPQIPGKAVFSGERVSSKAKYRDLITLQGMTILENTNSDMLGLLLATLNKRKEAS